MLRIAFDLSALQQALKKHSEYKDLRKLIGRFAAARSCRTDLLAVRSSLDTLSEMTASSATQRMALGQPLMLHAVVLYYRATHTDNDGRFSVGLTKYYSTEHSRKHNDIIKLRNQSMAHYGFGEGDYGKDWIRERVVMRGTEKSLSVTDVWSRHNFISRLIFDLDELSSIALVRAEEAGDSLQSELSKMLFQRLDFDKKLAELLIQFPFDPVEFYGSEDNAEMFWSAAHQELVHETATPRETSAEGDIQTGPSITTILSR